MADGVELASAYVTLIPSLKGAQGKIRDELDGVMTGGATASGKSAGKKFSGGFTGVVGRGLKTLGPLVGGIGIAALVKDSVNLQAQFGKTMAQVAAATGAPKARLGELRELAIKLGADTKFSAGESADAMLELAKAGISTSDIMGGALSGTLLLAAAGDVELANAATIASNAMNTFNMSGKDMNSIAAALAGGANASSASVQSLGEALSQVGPGATNAGLSLQETVGVLSAFDAAGVKGSDAGTSLKTMLTRLVPQTKKAKDAMADLGLKFTDAQGKFLPITNVAEQLRTRLAGLSEEQRTTALTTIFGSDATRAATVLMKEGADGIRSYIKATKDQGAAEELAAANMSGTAGALERLSGAAETAQLQIGEALAPAVVKVSDFLADDAIPAVTDFITGMSDGTGAGGKFANVLGDIVGVAGKAIGFIKDLPSPVKSFAVQAGAAAVALRLFSRGLTAVKTSAFVTGVTGMATTMRTAQGRMLLTVGTLQKLGGAIRQVGGAGGLMLLVDAGNRGSKAMSTLQGAAGGALAGFAVGGPVGAGIGAVAGGLLGLWRNSQKASSGVKTAAQTARDSIGQWKAYKDTLDGVTAAFTEQTREMVRSKLQKAGVLESTRKLGIADSTVVQGVAGNTKARQQLNAELNRQASALQKTVDWNNREYGAGSQLANQLNATALERLGNIDAIRREIGATDKAVDAKRRDRIITGEQSKAYQNIPQRVRTKFETPGRDLSYKGILEFGQQLKLTPKQVRTLIQTAGLPKSRGDVEKIKADLDALAKKRTEAKISANAKPARDEANRAGRHMRDVVKKPFRALIDANNRPALSASANVDRTLGGLGPYTPTIGANTGPARSAVSQVQGWINSLNTTFTLNAIFGGKRRGGGGGGGGRAAGGANRVVPRVVTPPAPRAVVMPQTMILRIPDGPTLRGYVEGVADDVVSGYAQLDYQAARTV